MDKQLETPKWLAHYALFTACFTFFLIIAGGMVTSTDSGLAVPDWPLAYGMWFPPMVGGIFYEHGHRMVAGVTGILILLLNLFLWKNESRLWVRRLGQIMLLGVVIQALLGGLTVILLLPPQISIAHAMLGQAIFCLTVAVAHALGKSWQGNTNSLQTISESVWRMCLSVPILVSVQLFLGAYYRHTGAALMPHVIGAFAVLIGICFQNYYVLRFAADMKPLLRMSMRLLLFVCLQIGLGLVAWMKPEWPSMVTAHVGLGALILAQSVLAAWTAGRCPRKTVSSPASSVA